MASKIEWTDETWNPITGCTKISAGCAHCYAERMARRLAGRCGYPEAPNHFDVTYHPDRMMQPTKWKKPRRVFVCSMSDLFHDDVPKHVVWAIWSRMSCTEQHTFQVLTKRPERALSVLNDLYAQHNWGDPSPNIWLGVTAENQRAANERIPFLLQIPAAVRFVSCEPLLGRCWGRWTCGRILPILLRADALFVTIEPFPRKIGAALTGSSSAVRAGQAHARCIPIGCARSGTSARRQAWRFSLSSGEDGFQMRRAVVAAIILTAGISA